jgi:hypothetical protein
MYHVNIQIKLKLSKAFFQRILKAWLTKNLPYNFLTLKCGGGLDMLDVVIS